MAPCGSSSLDESEPACQLFMVFPCPNNSRPTIEDLPAVENRILTQEFCQLNATLYLKQPGCSVEGDLACAKKSPTRDASCLRPSAECAHLVLAAGHAAARVALPPLVWKPDSTWTQHSASGVCLVPPVYNLRYARIKQISSEFRMNVEVFNAYVSCTSFLWCQQALVLQQSSWCTARSSDLPIR